MKKLLLGLLSLTFLLSCGEKKEPIWEYQSNLDLQTRYLNRIIELSGNDKFLRVFKRVGEKKFSRFAVFCLIITHFAQICRKIQAPYKF